MEKGKKIALIVFGTLGIGALGYYIYRRQQGAADAIAANTPNPSTGLTPVQENVLTNALGAWAQLQGKGILTPTDLYYVKDGQLIQLGNTFTKMFINFTKLNSLTGWGIKSIDDGVKRGFIIKISSSDFKELEKTKLKPTTSISVM